MVRIRRETDYAIRLLLALARKGPEAVATTRELQKEMQIPKQYAARVVAKLARGGFIKALQGRSGGISLGRPATEISLKDVVLHFEPIFVISKCVEDPASCPFGDTCPVRGHWCHLQSLLLKELERITIAELAAEPFPSNI
jgi:Rrf2 family protein